uniref:ABC transporter family protein n=1 Tax=Rhizophora mucronata TaxID=61149 RepID=A0A2P2M4J0_RHIMU
MVPLFVLKWIPMSSVRIYAFFLSIFLFFSSLELVLLHQYHGRRAMNHT